MLMGDDSDDELDPAAGPAVEKPMPNWDDLDNEDSSDDEGGMNKTKGKENDEKAEGDNEEDGSETSSIQAEEVNFENVPRRGDWEEDVDGNLVVHKGQGVKNRKTTLMNVIADPRFDASTKRFQVEYGKIISKLVRI
jgi:hypothetical protein